MSNKKFYVTSEETCDTCEGNGFIDSPAWQKWNEAFNRFDAHTKLEDGKPWHVVFEEYVKQNPQPDEPEQPQCADCEGVGIITRRVELREALAALEAADTCEAVGANKA